MQEFDYDVFFSYRHRPLDSELTRKTFDMLEDYRLPKAIREQGYPEIRRAFRDTEELPVSRILTESIDNALRSTNCLVVVCSEDTPESRWIDREVGVFIELGRADHIYPLLISGDPERSFPPSLKLVPDVMDRLLDVRTEGNSVKKMLAKTETELLRVVADITGCGEEELLREHHLRRNRRLLTRAAVASAIFLLIAGISLGLMRQAQNFRDTAARREQASLSILDELTYTLPDRLVNVPGAYRHLSGILYENTEEINAILRLSQNRETAEFEAAANYEKLATAQGVLGSYEEALNTEETATDIYRMLTETDADGGIEALASSYNNRGRLLNAAGRYPEAAEAFDKAIALYADAKKPDLVELATFTFNAASNRADSGDLDGAAALYEKSLRLLEGMGDTGEVVEPTARVNYNYGLILRQVGAYGDAEVLLQRACDLYSEMLENAQSLTDPRAYVQAVSALALCLTDEGRFQEADSLYARGIATAMHQAEDTENTDSLLNLAYLYNNRGLLLNMQEDYETADIYYSKAAELYRTVGERTGSPSDTAVYANAMLNIGENAFKAGNYAHSRDAFEEGLRAYSSVCQTLGSYDTAQYYAWLSYYELVHNRDPQAALEAGLAGYELQPNHVLVNINLAYACLYSGLYDDCDALLSRVASLGEGQIQNIRLDLDAQERAGMKSEHIDAVRQLLAEAAAPAAENGRQKL